MSRTKVLVCITGNILIIQETAKFKSFLLPSCIKMTQIFHCTGRVPWLQQNCRVNHLRCGPGETSIPVLMPPPPLFFSPTTQQIWHVFFVWRHAHTAAMHIVWADLLQCPARFASFLPYSHRPAFVSPALCCVGGGGLNLLTKFCNLHLKAYCSYVHNGLQNIGGYKPLITCKYL